MSQSPSTATSNARPRGRMKPCKRCGKDFYCQPARDVGGAYPEQKFCSGVCDKAFRQEVPDVERFWPKVTKGEGCWIWHAAKNDDGYGHFRSTQRKYVNAHRYSYQLHKGEIPAGMTVMHSCDNRACVNPDHLSLGTHAQNMRDMARRGRGTLGEKGHHAVLTAENVLEIRRLKAEGAKVSDLARQFGLGQSSISAVITRRSWRHI